MTAARIGLAGALALPLVLLALLWTIPTVAGPVVECGSLEPAVCDEVWREVAVDIGDWGPAAFLPVTRTQVLEATMEQPMRGTFTIERLWVFARSITYDCL
jgi:hypothetical protein